MKFITEYDLRAQFNEQPFTDYQVEDNTRLTPGARQFLSDRRINLFEDGTKMRFGVPAASVKAQEAGKKQVPASDFSRKAAEASNFSGKVADIADFSRKVADIADFSRKVTDTSDFPGKVTDTWSFSGKVEDTSNFPGKVEDTSNFHRKATEASDFSGKVTDIAEDSLAVAKLMSDMEILEAEILVITSQIIEENIGIAEQLSKVGHALGRVKSFLMCGLSESYTKMGGLSEPCICFEACTGMKGEDWDKDLGNCFEISNFYIQSANGKILVQMNALRAKIRALRIRIAEAFCEPEQEKRRMAATQAVNQIINKLSQMICMAAGVKECRRTQ